MTNTQNERETFQNPLANVTVRAVKAAERSMGRMRSGWGRKERTRARRKKKQEIERKTGSVAVRKEYYETDIFQGHCNQ